MSGKVGNSQFYRMWKNILCMNILFTLKLFGCDVNPSKNILSQNLKEFVCIYVNTIINFEWSYYFTACNMRLKHFFTCSLLSFKSYLLIIFMKGLTFNLTVRFVQYSSSFILKNPCWEISFHVILHPISMFLFVMFTWRS